MTSFLFLASLIVAFSGQGAPAPPSQPMPLVWKAVVMTGDDRIAAFDNARKAVQDELMQLGVARENIRTLSASRGEQNDEVRASSGPNLLHALRELNVGDGDACFVHVTSHGSTTGLMVRYSPPLTPAELDAIVGIGCGAHPTVLMVSACYSGVFLTPQMRKPNRVVLTAAREDRTSFGCSPESTYTYWDSSLIDNLTKADDWKGLYRSVTDCVEQKERGTRFVPSKPQAFFGDEVASLKIPAPVASGPGTLTSRCDVADDDTYGFSAGNAIKVGFDAFTGPARETKYLAALRGPTGERVKYRRIGSTIGADRTILDVYELTYDGQQSPARLFLDEYHFEVPKAPKGLVCGVEIGLTAKRPN